MIGAVTPVELARELGIDPRTLRGWMRAQGWRHEIEKHSRWAITPEQAASVRAHFAPASAKERGTPIASGLARLTVSEILASYREVLAELRIRGLIRTNNAPIGDLAEFCAAEVYDGVLAPNSEKSFDLTAADGRRVQVKVRQLRADTRLVAGFSPFRSLDVDACVFVLIDDKTGTVRCAREWTPEEVRAQGRHVSHTNGTVVRIRTVLLGDEIGVDVTERFDTAWRDLMARPR